MKIVITADGRNLAATTGGQPLTSGSVGIEAAFILSADYDDLAVTAVFSTEETRVDVLLTKSCCIVPWEVLQKPGTTLFVGVVGKNGSGEIVIPTVWGRVGMIECGTVADGLDPEDPTPDIAAQILEQARAALAEAAETKEAAAQSAQDAADDAGRAETAQQAVEDLGVTAHEDPDGPSVEKSVDPETGAVTLDFGFKPAGVTEVNGQTGAVSLDLDDIPDGAQYVRPTPAQVQQIGTNKDDIADIEDLIPNQATPQNQLADKDFVNSSINSSAAFFRGAFPTRAALFAVAWQTSDPTGANYVSNNDYAYVADDETHNDEAWRYLYVLQPGGTDNGWQPQFRVNESPLTAAQIAALNSGATAEIIASIADKYVLPEGGIPSADMSDAVRASLQKADTALQAVPDTYRTAAEQDAIDQAQDTEIHDLKSAKAPVIIDSAYGAIAHFEDGADGIPLKSLTVNIEPVQSGSGDPSPTNIRPISGWTGCNISHSGADTSDSTVIHITFPASAGTVYGGTLDVVNKKLTINKASIDMGDCDWTYNPSWNGGPAFYISTFADMKYPASNDVAANAICARYKVLPRNTLYGDTTLCGICVSTPTSYITVRDSAFTDAQSFKAGVSGSLLVYELTNPIEIPLSDVPQITTLLGTNNIWADCGDVSVEYPVDTQLAIDKQAAEISQIQNLYIGTWLQKHAIPTGYSDDALAPYRVTMANTVALPCGSERVLYGSIGDKYVFSIGFGACADNLNRAYYWYPGEFQIKVPNGMNFYRVSLARVEDNGYDRHDTVKITPKEDFNLKLYCKRNYSTLKANEEQMKKLSALKLFFSGVSGTPNQMNKYAVIAHTSDVHGDYWRLKNFYDFCDESGLDLACVTGDIVGYYPWNNLEWYQETVNNAKTPSAVCTGNHDVYDTAWQDGDVYDFMFAPIAEKIGNTTGKTWYYHDIASKNLRIISINLYQYGGTSRWYTHFTTEQLDWFVSTLNGTPANYGVVVLMHSPQTNDTKDVNYGKFYQDVRLYTNLHNAVSGGVPVYDIIDAFISKTTLSKTYTQTGTPNSITVSADFSNVNSGVEFIAYMTGHLHIDGIAYVANTVNKQLMLNVPCGIALYGGATYPYYADIGDIGRDVTNLTQDAFNVYVIDRDNKAVKVLRVGSDTTYQMVKRDYMVIPYAD